MLAVSLILGQDRRFRSMDLLLSNFVALHLPVRTLFALKVNCFPQSISLKMVKLLRRLAFDRRR